MQNQPLPPKKQPPPKLDNNQRLMVGHIFFSIFIVIISIALRPTPSAPTTTQSQATTAPRPTLIPAAPIQINGEVVDKDKTGPGFMVIPPTSNVIKYDSQGTPIKHGKILPPHETPSADAPSDFVNMD